MKWGMRLVSLLAGAALGVGATLLISGGDDGDSEGGSEVRLAQCPELIEALRPSAALVAGGGVARALAPLAVAETRARPLLPVLERGGRTPVRIADLPVVRSERRGAGCSERARELTARLRDQREEYERTRREVLRELRTEGGAPLAVRLGRSPAALRRARSLELRDLRSLLERRRETRR